MKVNWYAIGFFSVIAAVLFFWGWKCGNAEKVAPENGVVIYDTIPGKIEVVIDTQYVPKPYKVVQYKPVFKTDTLELTEIVQVDTSQIVLDYHRRRYYSDTVKIDFGHAIINDTVTENRIAGRGVKTNQRLPVIKETVTIFQPPRNILYLGFSGTGSKQNFFYSIGTDLSLKTRNDRIYSAGVNLTRDNQVLFEGGVKFPIRLRKN